MLEIIEKYKKQLIIIITLFCSLLFVIESVIIRKNINYPAPLIYIGGYILGGLFYLYINHFFEGEDVSTKRHFVFMSYILSIIFIALIIYQIITVFSLKEWGAIIYFIPGLVIVPNKAIID